MKTHALPLSAATAASAIALTVVSIGLSGCGKAQEAASEKAAEKMIEAQMSKDGTTAKVDLSNGSAKITATDDKGGVTQVEMGGAKVSEADVGLPFYPGAKITEGQGMRMVTPEGRTMSVVLESSDSPDKLATFYRDKLKAMSAGKQMMDMSPGDGDTTLGLSDDKAGTSLMVMVSKEEAGAKVTLMSNAKVVK